MNALMGRSTIEYNKIQNHQGKCEASPGPESASQWKLMQRRRTIFVPLFFFDVDGVYLDSNFSNLCKPL